MKRKGKQIKPKAVKVEENVDLSILPFHLYFPIHLIHKDGKEEKNCFFKDEIDMKKYIKRYKLKPKNYTVKDTESR
jgi:hypothetical protein